MSTGIDGQGSDDLLKGLVEQSASAEDLIRLSRSREDGFDPSEERDDSSEDGARGGGAARRSRKGSPREPSEAAEEVAKVKGTSNSRNWTQDIGTIDMIDDLTLTMNKVRQEAITRELLDIVGGVAALE